MPTDSQRGRDGLARDSVVRGELGVVVDHVPTENPVDIFHFHSQLQLVFFLQRKSKKFLIIVMKV